MPSKPPSADSPPFDRRAYPAGFALHEWRAPDGWPHRAYRWDATPGAARGSLLFQSGRVDFIEKYLETCDHFHARGWNVEGFDWRGQGGSGRLYPGEADDRDSMEPLIDDLVAFVKEWRARTPGPHVVVAHSMGGHVALRALAERGLTLDAVVLVAPMLGLNTGRLPRRVAIAIVRAALALGLARRAAWKDTKLEPRRQLRLTADRERYRDSHWWKERHPELGGGPPSWAWLGAAFDGLDRLHASPLGSVTTPVLVLTAGIDKLVDARAAQRVARYLPDAESIAFPDARHELLREVDRHRDAVLAAIDAWFDQRAPAA